MESFRLSVILLVSCLVSLSLVTTETVAAAETVSIECGSSYDSERMHCELPADAVQVQLERLISHQSCQFGVNWGLEENILWTENGCEASFTIRYGAPENPYENEEGPVPYENEDGFYTVDA